MIRTLYNRLMVNGRTAIVLKNSFLSLFLKGISIVVSFLLVPLCLRAVGKTEYGIILTITSVINWIAFFDIGMGNGLRTKLGKCIAEGDLEMGRKYVSTAYFYIAAIFLGILALYSVSHPLLDWYKILGIEPIAVANLNSCIYWLIVLFILRFILQLIGVILLADQQSYLNDIMMPVANLLTLIVIAGALKFGYADFYVICITIAAVPVLVLIAYTIFFFSSKYQWLRPSFLYVDHRLRKDLLALGIKFFLVQIATLIMFSSSNFLIARLLSMEEVTLYNIGNRYYGITLMVFGIILTPLWGAFTNAWYQHDKKWIGSAINRMVLVNGVFLIGGFLLFLCYVPVSGWWLGSNVELGVVFSLTMILYNFQAAFNNIYAYFLNAIGKVNIQLYAALIGGLLTVPVTVVLFRYTRLGLASICVANMICLLPGSVLGFIQVRKILSGTAKGKWIS